MFQTLLYVAISIAIGYVVLMALMYVMQDNIIYHPQKEILTTPASVGLTYEDIEFETDDQLKLHGWFVSVDSTAPTILYFHGNAGNISGRLETLRLLNGLGVNVFMFDYRGYGKSEGSPNETGTYRDATAAWAYLTEQRNISDDRIIIMGRSLGGSVAAWLAAQKNAAAAVIESTFTSAADLGADFYPWLPVRWILKYDYKTLEYMQQIEEPLFMAHSKDDQIVPYHHGHQLFEAAKEPKVFVDLRGAHGSGFWETGAKYTEALRQFLETHTSLNSPASG